MADAPEQRNVVAGSVQKGPIGDRALRQIWLIIMLAAGIAGGISLYNWAKEPAYATLYADLSGRDAAAVMESLQGSNIPVKIDSTTGAVMVQADKVHEARMKLAGEGLPAGGGRGFEILEKEQGFGTSQFIETARYNHALESELARSISQINSVESSRVHLAIAKSTTFMRKKNRSKASVFVKLYPGRGMTEGQVAAIVHLVASSVPTMDYEDVSVIDQRGQLLTREINDEFAASSKQLEYKNKLEESYIRRIESILEPIVGIGGVSASVSADIDFNYIESTSEEYNPDQSVVRSEQVTESAQNGNGVSAQGVPGALTNQPPGAGALASSGSGSVAESNSAKTAIRNFEVSKTINHRKSAFGTVKKLSVAVVVDNIAPEAGKKKEPLTQDKLDQLGNLIKESIGYDDQRGDTVNIMNATFQEPPTVTAAAPGLMDQPWFWNAVKIGAFVFLGLLLLMMVIRPTLKAVIPKEVPQTVVAMPAPVGPAPEPKEAEVPRIELQTTQFDKDVEAARNIATSDPALAANVVKHWIEEGQINPAA